MKKNKLIIFITTILLMTGCSKNKIDDPLIVPPNFSQIPDLQNPEPKNSEASTKDMEELKDLLLKNN
jgi:hypothetical protein